MTTLAENSNRDIFVDATGNLATVTEIDQCAQCCKSTMEVVIGECVLDLQNGQPYETAMWNRYLPRQFETVARRRLGFVLNVTGVVSFVISRAGSTANYAAAISTSFGKNITISGVIPNVV